ncbi:hypothetical protein [Streptomyces sp. NPDC088847]|uniref:hypothetical protein n=1 Tax=Streptomyces sp. NPDC088847 TaxID=3365909 RepID=UPI00381484C7
MDELLEVAAELALAVPSSPLQAVSMSAPAAVVTAMIPKRLASIIFLLPLR